MTHPDLLIFDMDGVLVDVSDSYRETISRTVEHFTASPVTADRIQEFKNQGGWNDDWALSFRLVRDAGVEVGYDTLVNYFNSIFHGEKGDGLIRLERWNGRDGLFERLARQHRLAIFTGRLHWEAEVTLARFAPNRFDPIIGSDDVTATKPDPEGIRKIRAAVPHRRVFYLGDMVDDAKSAQSAGVPFIGIIGPRTPLREQSIQVLRSHDAIAVLDNINQLEDLLATL